jgi:sigma-B regulation protein RsbU (phosphoserine phosphatase)
LCRTHHAGAFFEVAGASLPCRAIGGDFLEFIDLPSGGMGVAVGDVSGKGPAAALVAAMLQGMFSMVAIESADPGTALARVNRALYRRGIEPRFATLAYAVLTPDGRLTYSNAGHNPPLLLTQSGVARLTVGGPMLGVFERAEFPQATHQLEPGDGLVAFSDGVTDAVAANGDDFGTERLIASAAQTRSSGPDQILAGLFETVREFCGSTAPVDDVTMAVLRFTGVRP